MTRDPLAVAAKLLQGRAGLNSEPMVRSRLNRCLEQGAEAAGLGLDDYLLRVDSDPIAFQELLDRVTVQHSYFFRDRAQFDALEGLLPGEASPLVVWSAACGNGQEPYSLAMLLAESGHPNWTVVATDVSGAALVRARAARYTAAELGGISAARLSRHFTPVAGGYEVVQALRDKVIISHHNLATSSPPMAVGTCSVVFCRNVLIYFGEHQFDACIDRLAAWMRPGSHLFLGFSESLWKPSGFELVRLDAAYVYRRKPAIPLPTHRPREIAVRSPEAVPQLAGLGPVAAGEAAFAAGDTALAIRSFRQATYLDPDEPIGYFQLGTALELAGDQREARRAFAAAGAALARSGPDRERPGLDGYTLAELGRAIAAKLVSG